MSLITKVIKGAPTKEKKEREKEKDSIQTFQPSQKVTQMDHKSKCIIQNYKTSR